MAEGLIPLLAWQDYIQFAGIWRGEEITHHLDYRLSLKFERKQDQPCPLVALRFPRSILISRPASRWVPSATWANSH